MAETFKIRICYLLSELTANALIILCALNTARAVSACTLKPFLNSFYDFPVRIQFYRQVITSFNSYFS